METLVVLVPTVVETLVVPVLEEETTAPPRTQTERRFPAPQSSAALPGQAKEQSAAGATTDPAEKLLPQ